MKVLVFGGREFQDRKFLFDTLDALHKSQPFTHVIHGAYKGADALADEWAMRRGVQPVRCPANWDWFGPPAGPIRNRSMLELNPDYWVAFTGGVGTADMIGRLMDAKIPGEDHRRPRYEFA